MAGRRNQKKVNRRTKVGVDFALIVITLFLVAFGLIMIYSASSYESMLKFEDSAYYFNHQLRATVIALVVFIAVSFIDYHLWGGIVAIASYGVAVIACALVRTSIGIEVNGAKRWIRVAGQSVQPAEIAKIATILFLAFLIVKFGNKKVNTLKGSFYILAAGWAMALWVYRITSNLSSGIIIAGMTVIMLFVSVRAYWPFVTLGAIGSAGIAAGVYFLKSGIISDELSYRLARITTWLDPEKYASGRGFQTLQGLYSIGSGGLMGKGLGQSMQKLGSLPEAQNDMIFSIICEELGIFGAITVIGLFLALIVRFVAIAQNAPDKFGSLLVVGVMGHISLQVIFNIGVVTNTIPNTGITLPFISYGGTSIIFTMIEIAIVLNVSKSITLEE